MHVLELSMDKPNKQFQKAYSYHLLLPLVMGGGAGDIWKLCLTANLALMKEMSLPLSTKAIANLLPNCKLRVKVVAEEVPPTKGI